MANAPNLGLWPNFTDLPEELHGFLRTAIFVMSTNSSYLRYTETMTLAIDDAFLPATLAPYPMTDEEFSVFCSEHPDLNFEMTAEGELIVMAPTHFAIGNRNAQINHRLFSWAEKDSRGIVGESSTGFVLPNGARRSPDASWTLLSRITILEPIDRDGFLHLCPDFVIELRSDTDRLSTLRKKMSEYIANGAQLGWLIDPKTSSVEIYRPGQETEVVTGILTIEGEGPVPGFVLPLERIWNPFGV